MKELAWVNGEISAISEAKVSFLDHGYFYGYGVYEALKVYNGKPFAVKEHMDRLDRSMGHLNIVPRYTRREMVEAMHTILEQSGLTGAMIYLQVTRGVGFRHHILKDPNPTVSMFISNLPPVPQSVRQNGIKAIIVPDDRWAHPHIKTLNLLPNILAKQAAEEKQAYEAILVKENGRVTEAASSNVFAVFGDTIVTPPTDGKILNGVTRMILLTLLEQHGYSYKEDYISAAELHKADEVFVTNTGAEVLAVTRLDEQKVGGGVPGIITQQLYDLFMEEVERRNAAMEVF